MNYYPRESVIAKTEPGIDLSQALTLTAYNLHCFASDYRQPVNQEAVTAVFQRFQTTANFLSSSPLVKENFGHFYDDALVALFREHWIQASLVDNKETA